MCDDQAPAIQHPFRGRAHVVVDGADDTDHRGGFVLCQGHSQMPLAIQPRRPARLAAVHGTQEPRAHLGITIDVRCPLLRPQQIAMSYDPSTTSSCWSTL